MILEDFEKLVASAVIELPQKIRDNMDNVAIVIENAPSREQERRGGTKLGGLLLGLYEGIPKTRRGLGYTGVLPDKITIFKNSIEAVAATADEIKAQVQETVWHEIAHHYGLGEEAVRKLAHKRKTRGV
jgi:predicted Zn-dependent protease with MMP-like domain